MFRPRQLSTGPRIQHALASVRDQLGDIRRGCFALPWSDSINVSQQSRCFALIQVISSHTTLLHLTSGIFQVFHWYPMVSRNHLVQIGISPDFAHGEGGWWCTSHPVTGRLWESLVLSCRRTASWSGSPRKRRVHLVGQVKKKLKSSGLVTNMDLSSGS